MNRAQKGVPFFLLLLFLSPALYFLLPISSESSDPSQIDALAPVEVVAEGFQEPAGVVVDQAGAIFENLPQRLQRLTPFAFCHAPVAPTEKGACHSTAKSRKI